MNIAIAATSPEADAQVDQHGARAPYYQFSILKWDPPKHYATR